MPILGALLPSPVWLRLEPGRSLLQLSQTMSNTAAALEQRALECEQKAALTTDEAQRRTFLEIAKAWREMAADYQELSRKGATAAARPSRASRGNSLAFTRCKFASIL